MDETVVHAMPGMASAFRTPCCNQVLGDLTERGAKATTAASRVTCRSTGAAKPEPADLDAISLRPIEVDGVTVWMADA